MKAVLYERYGNPSEVLQVRERPTPQPGFRQVLVRMLAAPVNPSDLLTVEDKYGKGLPPPATPGYEGVGIVQANGGGVLGWLRRGRRVALINDRGGTWAEECVVLAKQVVPVPDDVPDEQAAMFFVNPVTAVAMTQHVLKVPRDSWLLQTAAGSALGQMVIRLGKMNGFRTINVVRRREQAEQLRALGGDATICEPEESVDERVRQLTDGRGVPFVLDAVGGKTGSNAVRTLGQGGRAILYGVLSEQPVEVDPRLMIMGGKRVEGFWLAKWLPGQGIATMLGIFRRVKQLMREGVVKSDVAATYPLDRVADAMRHAQAPARGGKILLKIASK
jgi:NADPH:quinone reductase-like Zn-dependent oxidoreductase